MQIHFPPDLQSRLSSLALDRGQDSETLVVQAVERMMEHEDWFIAEVERGMTQVKSGKTLSHEEVGERLEKYLASKLPV